MSKSGSINATNFFGEGKVEQYRQELVADGKIPGTRQSATPEERKEGLRLYRKNKVEFKTFVENVLKKKASAGGGGSSSGGTGGGGGSRPTRGLLPGTATASIIKYNQPTGDIVQKQLEKVDDIKDTKDDVEDGLDDILDRIDDLLKEIRNTTKYEKSVIEKDRKEKEKERRESRENKLEGIKNFLAGPAQKVFAPIRSFFQQIMDAIGKILFAKVGMKLIDWYSEPGNAEKLNNVIKFMRKHWLLIVGGLLLFGTRLNGIVMFLMKIALKFIPAIIKMTFDLIRAAGLLALKIGKKTINFIRKPGAALSGAKAVLANPLVRGGAATAGIVGTAVLANEITGQRQAAGTQSSNKAKAQTGRGVGLQGVGGVGDLGPTTPYGMLQGLDNGGPIQKMINIKDIAFNGGGGINNDSGIKITGAGPDTQLIAGQPGEVVFSKNAVDYWGLDNLLSMNKMGGGDNRPKMKNGIMLARGGGSTGSVVNPFPEGSYKAGPGQKFGDSRSYGGHVGIDITENYPYKSDPKRPIYAATSGKILGERYQKSGYTSGLMIDHGDGYQTRYLHMTPMRNIGDTVQAGQQIGKLLDLGDQTHLHLELYQGSKLLNPTNFFMSATKGNYIPGGAVPGDIASAGEGVTVSPGTTSEQPEINPIQYMIEVSQLYKEIYGTSPSQIQPPTQTSTTSAVPAGVKPPASSSGGISNDIPAIGSVDPNNKSLIGMRAMHNIVG